MKAMPHMIFATRPSALARWQTQAVIGALRATLEEAIRTEQLTGLAWLAGGRDDVPEVMQSFDLFVLPSLSEGISNTILEAMASGLPVIATRVGGNAELVVDGETGVPETANPPGSGWASRAPGGRPAGAAPSSPSTLDPDSKALRRK